MHLFDFFTFSPLLFDHLIVCRRHQKQKTVTLDLTKTNDALEKGADACCADEEDNVPALLVHPLIEHSYPFRDSDGDRDSETESSSSSDSDSETEEESDSDLDSFYEESYESSYTKRSRVPADVPAAAAATAATSPSCTTPSKVRVVRRGEVTGTDRQCVTACTQ